MEGVVAMLLDRDGGGKGGGVDGWQGWLWRLYRQSCCYFDGGIDVGDVFIVDKIIPGTVLLVVVTATDQLGVFILSSSNLVVVTVESVKSRDRLWR